MQLSKTKSRGEPPMLKLSGGPGAVQPLLGGRRVSVKGRPCGSFNAEPYNRWDPDRGESLSASSSIPVFRLRLWQLVWHPLLSPPPDGWSPFSASIRGDTHQLGPPRIMRFSRIKADLDRGPTVRWRRGQRDVRKGWKTLPRRIDYSVTHACPQNPKVRVDNRFPPVPRRKMFPAIFSSKNQVRFVVQCVMFSKSSCSSHKKKQIWNL